MIKEAGVDVEDGEEREQLLEVGFLALVRVFVRCFDVSGIIGSYCRMSVRVALVSVVLLMSLVLLLNFSFDFVAR